jgi:hypothetical protein
MDNLVIDIWIIPIQKTILVTDLPGPPAAICGYVSSEAKKAAQERGYPTVSEIGFPSDLHLGPFHDWKAAREAAEARAQALGYTVDVEDSMFPVPDIGEGDDLWDEDEYDD